MAFSRIRKMFRKLYRNKPKLRIRKILRKLYRNKSTDKLPRPIEDVENGRAPRDSEGSTSEEPLEDPELDANGRPVFTGGRKRGKPSTAQASTKTPGSGDSRLPVRSNTGTTTKVKEPVQGTKTGGGQSQGPAPKQ